MYSLNIVLLLLLLVAGWHDIRSRRIPNSLVFSGMILGVLLNILLPPEMGGLELLDSLAGLVVGLVLLLPFYLLRVMAAGDVKLMAMTGTFLGASGAADALLCVLLAGGVLSLGIAWRQGKLRELLRKLRKMLYPYLGEGPLERFPMAKYFRVSGIDTAESIGKVPYGVAIAVGTMIYLVIAPLELTIR